MKEVYGLVPAPLDLEVLVTCNGEAIESVVTSINVSSDLLSPKTKILTKFGERREVRLRCDVIWRVGIDLQHYQITNHFYLSVNVHDMLVEPTMLALAAVTR